MACFNDTPIAFIAVIHFPHPRINNFKRIHRLVVLPDYQGIGIGTTFLNYISNIYTNSGYRVRLITGQINLIHSLSRNGWRCDRVGRVSPILGKMMRNTQSANRLTASFEYIGD